MHALFHCLNPYIEAFRDLAIGEIIDPVHQEDDTLGFGKVLERAIQPNCKLILFQYIMG